MQGAWLGWEEQASILGRIFAGFQAFGTNQTGAELCVTQHSGAIPLCWVFFFARFVSHPARKDQPGLLTSLSPAAQKREGFPLALSRAAFSKLPGCNRLSST